MKLNQSYIFINEPPFHYQKLFIELCKVKKIKILSLHISKYKTSSIVVENDKTFDFPKNLDSIKLEELLEDKENENYNTMEVKNGMTIEYTHYQIN